MGKQREFDNDVMRWVAPCGKLRICGCGAYTGLCRVADRLGNQAVSNTPVDFPSVRTAAYPVRTVCLNGISPEPQ